MSAADALRHAPPQPNRVDGPPTLLLPVSGDGNVDSPHGEESPTSVYWQDDFLATLLQTTMNREPSTSSSYCLDGCGEGCTGVPAAVADFDAEQELAAPFKQVIEAMEMVTGALTTHAGELMVDRLNAVYGPGGEFDLAEVMEQTDTIYDSLITAVEQADEAATSVLMSVHSMIVQARDKLAARADAQFNAVDVASLAAAFTPLAPVKIASFAYDAYRVYEVIHNSHSELDTEGELAKLKEIAEPYDQAVRDFKANVEGWSFSPNRRALNLPTVKSPTAPGDAPVDDPAELVSNTTPQPSQAETKPSEMTESDLDDALGKLLGSGKNLDNLAPSMPDMPSPVLGGMPSMPEMPSPGLSTGGVPEMPPLSDDLTEPHTDPELDEDEDITEDITEDTAEDPASEEEDSGDVDQATSEGEGQGEPQGEGDDQAEADPAEGVAPVTAQAEPPAEPDPNSPEARTVTTPDGKQVTFPSKAMADAVRHLMDADPSNPKSLYMAASEAGYHLPPMGQDIGEKVPPGLMREGDILVADGHNGIYLGNREVLMEDQSVKPLDEVATFDGPNQGVFRLEEPSAGGPGLSGVEQPVEGNASPVSDTGTVSTPGEVTDQPGSPGIPTDDANSSPAVDSGIPSNTEGLDASSVFSS